MTSEKPDISIVIRADQTPEVIKCLNSIDEPNAEIILVMAGESSVSEEFLKRFPVKVVRISEFHMARAQNAGIMAASSDKVLLMDADCCFAPGSIRALCTALDASTVAKGKVVFAASGVLERMVARLREHHEIDEVKAYTPLLAIRTDVIDRIGGYFFDERLEWIEDDELSRRIRKANVVIAFDPQAVAFHLGRVDVRRDLLRAYRFGGWHFREKAKVGQAIASSVLCL